MERDKPRIFQDALVSRQEWNERKIIISRFIVPTIVFSIAFGLTINKAEAANPKVVSTWKGGIHFLPAAATRSDDIEEIVFRNNETIEQWRRRLTQKTVKPHVKIPAVIYAHGCKGPQRASDWAATFNEFGFAFFAPDSFRRPGRVPLCYRKGTSWKISMRNEEIKFALQQIKKLDWIDQHRIILVGNSEGGRAVAEYKGSEFIAHIIMAYDCKRKGRKTLAPRRVAVLNLVGAKDPREKLCSIRRKAGGSKAVSLPGQAHQFEGDPMAEAAIAAFLRDCCGYQPTSTIGEFDENAVARKLVEEFGGMASLDAMLKADEALAKGDKKGQAFWMRVHEIAAKLTGG